MPIWRRFGWAWDQLARRNALGAILTRDGEVGDWNLSDFLATGRDDVARFVTDLSLLAPSAPRTRALDFGCGVGRITRALANHFEEVVGVDASPTMIRQASALHSECRQCTFVLNRAPELRRFATGTFAVVYSRLVLQHLRPALTRRYIPELVRVLAPGGALMFQLPEPMWVDPREAFEQAPVLGNAFKRRLPRPLVVAYRRLKYRFIVPDPGPQIEMHGMRKDEVLGLIRSAGGRLLEARPDASHGYPTVAGFEYWVTR